MAKLAPRFDDVPDCGHAPSLMADHQIRVIDDFLLVDDAAARRAPRTQATIP